MPLCLNDVRDWSNNISGSTDTPKNMQVNVRLANRQMHLLETDVNEADTRTWNRPA